jgi:hypothetical protein
MEHVTMRALIISAALLIAPAAWAQDTPPQKPLSAAPAASAPFEQREQWCEQFASWFVASTPQNSAAPADVRQTHEFEIEFNSCKIDPQEYERDTRAEAQLHPNNAAG